MRPAAVSAFILILMPNEVEIKFPISDLTALKRALRQAGFRLKTRRTHEMNTLYDLPGQPLRRKGELFRLRKYGVDWVLTHKAKDKSGRHKSRFETEVEISDGAQMDAILRRLGFQVSFRYEKFRTAWADKEGHVLVDETPIGNLGEIEGPARWIDRTAKRLRVTPQQYITASYAELFFAWKKRTGSRAREMTFAAVKKRKPSAS